MCHGYIYPIRTNNHGEVAQFMFKKRFIAISHHLLPIHNEIFVLKMCHGYMYGIRTYYLGEFFCNILAPKLMAEVLKWLILCLTRDLLLVHTIYYPYITKFLFLKCAMVICTLYVHITMANFSPIFYHQN